MWMVKIEAYLVMPNEETTQLYLNKIEKLGFNYRIIESKELKVEEER